MSYSGFKEDLLEFISNRQWLIFNNEKNCFVFNNRDIYDLYDGCESTKDASDALNSLWKYDGELARIEVSKIDKALIADRESVPSKGYFYALAKYAPAGFEMHEKFKLDERKEENKIPGKIPPSMSGLAESLTTDCVINEQTNNKETEMDSAEKEYARSVWNREVISAEKYLYEALKNPLYTFNAIRSIVDVEEYMVELRRLQDEYANRYRMAKKQLDALK